MNQPADLPTDWDVAAPRTAIILCQVLELEIEHFAAGSDHIARIVRLEQGLHNEPNKLRQRVQAAVDDIEQDADVEVIVLGYGLCSRGTEGVRTARCRLVIPCAHDCITLLLGDKKRYSEYVAKHPGTYWYSPGWIKHHLPPGPQRHEAIYREYCEKYGEDNAKYLVETEQQWHANYDRATYIDVGGIGASPEDVEYTQECARWLGWNFDRQCGDPGLLRQLVLGPWDPEHFVIVPPGKTIGLTGDDRVIDVVCVAPIHTTLNHTTLNHTTLNHTSTYGVVRPLFVPDAPRPPMYQRRCTSVVVPASRDLEILEFDLTASFRRYADWHQLCHAHRLCVESCCGRMP